MADNVRFIRAHGRVIPIRRPPGSAPQKPQQHVEAVTEAVAKGVAAGGAAFGAAKGAQYAMFKRGSRIQEIASRYARWPTPRMGLTQVAKGRGFQMLSPDIYQVARFHRDQKVAASMAVKATKWQGVADKTKKIARTFGKWALPVAAVTGIAAGIYAYRNREGKQ